MKKTKINLILKKEEGRKAVAIFDRFRFITLLYSLIFVLATIIFFIATNTQLYTLSLLNLQRKNLLTELQANTEEEAGYNYIAKKMDLLDKYISTDPKLVAYYEILNSSVKEGSDSATLGSFAINNDRDVQFKVSFKSEEQMIEFLKTIESVNFIKNFQSLRLIKIFNLLGNVNRQDQYSFELAFEGKFKKINGN